MRLPNQAQPAIRTMDISQSRFQSNQKMIIYHCVPKAARRFLLKKLRIEFPRKYLYEHYEPMDLYAEQTNPDELSVLFDRSMRKIYRIDPLRRRRIDIFSGLFTAKKFWKKKDDFSFTFIRHPVDRFYSGYYYAHHYLSTGTEKSRDGSGRVRYRERYPEMVDFFCQDIESFVKTFLNSQGKIRFNRNGTSYGPINEIFFLPSNLDQHDFVGVVETMSESLEILNCHLGTNIQNDERVNENPSSSRSRYGEEELMKFFAADIEVFERYKAKLVSWRSGRSAAGRAGGQLPGAKQFLETY